jgi:hypothetical protein
MAARYSIGRRTADGSNAAAALEIRAGAFAPAYVREITITLAQATASIFGIGRPAVIGITPTAPVTVMDEAGGDASEASVTTAVAWGTGPTVPAQFFRRVGLPAAIGQSYTFSFPNGLTIPAGGSIVVWNLAANALADVTVIAG